MAFEVSNAQKIYLTSQQRIQYCQVEPPFPTLSPTEGLGIRHLFTLLGIHFFKELHHVPLVNRFPIVPKLDR